MPEEEPAAFIRPNEFANPRPQAREAGRTSGSDAGKYGLVINFKTANTLGVTVTAALLARADEVTE